MKDYWQRFRTAWLIQLAVFFVVFVVWFYIRSSAYLAGPPDGDVYAQTWSFQLMVGGIYLLGAIPLLAAVFIAEAGICWVFWRLMQRRSRVAGVSPNQPFQRIAAKDAAPAERNR